MISDIISPIGVFLVISIAVMIFLIFRHIICWYWKINLAVCLLADIRNHLIGVTGLEPLTQSSKTYFAKEPNYEKRLKGE